MQNHTKKKILIISPHFFPMTEGLSGHTKEFAKRLVDFHDVEILTSAHLESKNEYGYCVHNTITSWKFGSNFKIISEVLRISPDRIFIQYLPFLYARRGGINFSVVFIFVLLHLLSHSKIDVMLHELFYPKEKGWKAHLMHYCHRIMLWGVTFSADKLFVSTQSYKNYMDKKYPLSQCYLLPVGANIDAALPTETEKEEFKKKYALGDNLVLTLFGFQHPSKRYDLIFRALSEFYRETKSSFKVLFIGQTKDDLKSLFFQNHSIKEFVVALGLLEDSEVITSFKCSDLFIGYFSDGMSMRRGSVMAPLKFGVPVVTTRSDVTDEIFTKSSQITLLPIDSEEFVTQLKEHLKDFKNKKISFDSAFYENNFSWSAITKLYLKSFE